MFTPHTESDIATMLKTVGVSRLEDLFKVVPENCRYPNLDLPAGLTEMEARQELEILSDANESGHNMACFLGAGAYNHYSSCSRGCDHPPR